MNWICCCCNEKHAQVSVWIFVYLCERDTVTFAFICVYTRYSKVRSATAHQRALFPGMSVAESALVRRRRSPHQKSQSAYVACPSHPPAFVGHTESLRDDWLRFVEAFEPELNQLTGTGNGYPRELPHRHDKQKRGSEVLQDTTTNLGPALDDPWWV